MKDEKRLRWYLRQLPVWHEAHADWKTAVSGVPAKFRGVCPRGASHSPWQLLEHMSIAAWDIVEFACNAKHVSPEWPSGYWPQGQQPPNAAAWNKSVIVLRRALEKMGKLVSNPRIDLLAPIPHGKDQTVLRQALLLADHNAYHVGQLILTRRLLGCWKEA